MSRARLIVMNSALGPARLSGAAGHEGRAGLDRRRAFGPAPADRRGLGARAAADRGGRRQSAAQPPPRLRSPTARRPAAPARGVDRGLLSRAARVGAAHGPALLGRARRRALDHRISRDRPGPGAPDPAARAGAGADRRAAGPGFRAGDHRRRLGRRDPRPGQDGRDRGDRGDDRRSLPDPRSRPRSRQCSSRPRPKPRLYCAPRSTPAPSRPGCSTA